MTQKDERKSVVLDTILDPSDPAACEARLDWDTPTMPAVCVIIPTKDRPDDLKAAVRSILAQTILPRFLLIVDQSADIESRRRVERELEDARSRRSAVIELNYIHEPSITGGAMARNCALAVADGDIWLFLDDDVVLEPDFVEQLLAVYREYPRAGGVSGIITNYPRPPLGSRIWRAVFMRGAFCDERQPIYWDAERLRGSAPIRVTRFGGGLMSFRSETIRQHRFDENLSGVSEGEDVDFCTRLGPGTILLLTPRARLAHYHSPSGRLTDHWLRRHARGTIYLYRKHWKKSLFNRLCHGWLWVGYALIAAIASARRRSLEPWQALRTGAGEARAAVKEHATASETAAALGV